MIPLLLLTSPSPTPAPTPSPPPRFSLAVSGSNVFIDQATSGPGQTPPEGPSFAAGEPIAPMSPYEWFSTAPELPGIAGQIQYQFTGTYRAGNNVTSMRTTIGGGSPAVTLRRRCTIRSYSHHPRLPVGRHR